MWLEYTRQRRSWRAVCLGSFLQRLTRFPWRMDGRQVEYDSDFPGDTYIVSHLKNSKRGFWETMLPFRIILETWPCGGFVFAHYFIKRRLKVLCSIIEPESKGGLVAIAIRSVSASERLDSTVVSALQELPGSKHRETTTKPYKIHQVIARFMAIWYGEIC